MVTQLGFCSLDGQLNFGVKGDATDGITKLGFHMCLCCQLSHASHRFCLECACVSLGKVPYLEGKK